MRIKINTLIKNSYLPQIKATTTTATPTTTVVICNTATFEQQKKTHNKNDKTINDILTKIMIETNKSKQFWNTIDKPTCTNKILTQGSEQQQ